MYLSEFKLEYSMESWDSKWQKMGKFDAQPCAHIYDAGDVNSNYSRSIRQLIDVNSFQGSSRVQILGGDGGIIDGVAAVAQWTRLYLPSYL